MLSCMSEMADSSWDPSEDSPTLLVMRERAPGLTLALITVLELSRMVLHPVLFHATPAVPTFLKPGDTGTKIVILPQQWLRNW